MTFSEQRLINQIKIAMQRAKIYNILFIIHNLKTFISVKQVENYIEEYLLKNASFDLAMATINFLRKDDVFYYEKDSSPKIFHLIFANEGSEAGQFYNNNALNFLEKSIQYVANLKSFDVIDAIKDNFIDVYKDFMEVKD